VETIPIISIAPAFGPASTLATSVHSAPRSATHGGLVKSLNRPEANVTGMSFTTSQLAPKRLDLLCQLVPQATLVGYLDNVATGSDSVRSDFVAAARSLGRQVVILNAGTEQEIDAAFDAMAKQQVGAIVVSTDANLNSRQDQIVALAARHALPAIYPVRGPVEKGGLMSYGTLGADMFRLAGIYTGRILKGEKPADLPVMLPTRFQFVINMKTANALGLTVPLALQIAVDEVIE
jgi:putative ABC transport system substrate-binding protein